MFKAMNILNPYLIRLDQKIKREELNYHFKINESL